MYVQRSDVAAVTALPLPPVTALVPRLSTGFAQVFDLAEERARRVPPPEVLEAVDEAAHMVQLLDAAGMQVRFDLSGGVSAQLRDRTGAVVRPLGLHEVMDPSSLLPPDAAA